MGFQDGAILHDRASFSTTTFQKNYGRDEGLRTTTCHKTVVGVSKAMLPEKYFCSIKPLFVSVKFNGDHKTATKMR